MKYKMVLRFPFPVRMESENEVYAEVDMSNTPVFNEDFARELDKLIGKRDAAILLDSETDRIVTQTVTSQIIGRVAGVVREEKY